MAGDLSDCAALARCLEQNATRTSFTLDNIFEKYNREFPKDDVIDIRCYKIVRNRGNVVSMPCSKVGFATHQKVHPKEGTPFNSTLLESPGSEKSFISANCSKWAMDITEESEPSDAETITDTSDSDSWEEEEDKSESVSLSGSEDTDRDPDWYFSEHGVEQGSEERGKWLSIRSSRKELIRQQQRQQFDAERKRVHRHERTKTRHSSLLHRSAEKASCVSKQSAKPQHPVYFPAQRNRNKHHRNIKQQNSGWGSAGRPIHSSSLSRSPLKERIGPPRRVTRVRLFQNEESPERLSSPSSSVIVISSDGGEDPFGSNQQNCEENSLDDATEEYRIEQKSPSPLQDEVDSFSPVLQMDNIVHAASSNYENSTNMVVLRESQCVPDRGDYNSDNWIESCHPGQEDRCLLNMGSNGLNDLTESDCSKHAQGTSYEGALDYKSPQISRRLCDKTFTVPPSGSHEKTIFQSCSSKDCTFQSGFPNSNIFQFKTSHPDIFHFRRSLPMRNLGLSGFVLKDWKQMSDRGDTDFALCKQDTIGNHLQRSSVIACRKDIQPEKCSNKGVGNDFSPQIDDANLASADSKLQQKTNITFCRPRMQGSSSATRPSEEIVAKLTRPQRNCAQVNGLTSESFIESSSQGNEDMGTSLLELQRKLDFLTNNMSPKNLAHNTPTDPKPRSGGTLNNGHFSANTDKLRSYGQQHTPKIDFNMVSSGLKTSSNFNDKLALRDDVKRDSGSPQKSHPDASSKLALRVEVNRESCAPLKANPNVSSKFTPEVEVRVDSSSPFKSNPIANISIGIISPLPLVKIESPQHWAEVKRKFCPVYETVSTEEIQHVLEMPDSDSVVNLLKQKYKTEPSSPPQEATQKDFQNSPQPPLHSELVSKSSANSSKQPVSTPKIKQQPTSRPAFAQNETEVLWSNVKKPDCPAVTHFLPDQMDSGTDNYGPSPRLDRYVPLHTTSTTEKRLPVGVGVFHSSPGEMIRQTITPPPQPMKEQTRGNLVSDNSLVSNPVQPSVSSIRKSRASMRHLSSPSLPGLQNELTKRSDLGSSSPESKSQSLSRMCDHGCTCGQDCKSNSGQKSQKKLSGSAIQQIFTQLKQVSETKKISRSLDRTKLVQPLRSCSATDLREVQQKNTLRSLFSEKANLGSSENAGTCKSGAAVPERHQNDLCKWLSDLPYPSHSRKLLPPAERKINTQFSLLAQLDADESRTQENVQLTTKINRKGTHAMTSSPNYNFSEKLSQNTAEQQMKPAETVSAETAAKLTSYLRRSNGSLQDSKGLRNSSSLDQATTSSTCQYRVQSKQYAASDFLSPNSKSRNQSLEKSQSLTPSKLIAELNLGEVCSPLNLSQDCEAMSRLFLASPVGRGKKQSSDPAECGQSVTLLDFVASDAGQRKSCRTPVCRYLTESEKPEETLWTRRHMTGKESNCVQPTWDRTSEPTCDAEPRTQTSKLSVSHAVQLSGSRDFKRPSVKVSASCQDMSVNKSSRAENSACLLLKSKDTRDTFTSRNPDSQEPVEVRPSSSGTTSFRASSPKLRASDHAGSKPLNCKGTKMVHIHSPRRMHPRETVFSFTSDYSSFSPPAKRVFQSDVDVFGELSRAGSPHKRRRITSIGATSTPSRSNKPYPINFNMDESLSTIAGDSNDLNCTVQSAEGCSSAEESGSESEDDEITLISE